MEANRYYYRHIVRLLRFIIEPGSRVLDLRCMDGGLLKAVEPSYGVGVDITEEMLDVARKNYPEAKFIRSDPEALNLEDTFDYILFSNLFDTVDVLAAFQRLRRLSKRHTRLVVYNYNHLWEPVLNWASRIGLRTPFVEPNWLSIEDLEGFLRLSGFEVLRTYRIILFPKWIPLVSEFLNRFVARLPLINRLCMVTMLVARVIPEPIDPAKLTVSVIVPCRNERDNIQPAVERTPNMGGHTEIIFSDDHSTDGTADEVRRMQRLYPELDIRLTFGPGVCKSENVWTGFRAARGDVLMILDGDLAVLPEELPYFLSALAEGRGEFINGSRLVYPMQMNAMKVTNWIGNKFFSGLFSMLLNQHVKDTLCGTKVLWRRDWERIERRLLGRWGVRDLWGDYELLFSASKLHLRIQDLPVHYQERIYGVTKMQRVFANGLRMLRMCWAAAVKLKGGY